MSWDEHHFGKLVKVEYSGSIEEFCKSIINKPLTIYDTYKEWLVSDYEYIITNDCIYKILEDYRSDDCYGTYLIPNEDGSINFFSSFYNGGTCLLEELEEALSKYESR